MRIVNVKLSGLIKPFSSSKLCKENIVNYSETASRITFKSRIYKGYSFFILGKTKNHLNITGFKLISDISNILKKFLTCCSDDYCTLIDNFKIDSLTCVDKGNKYREIYSLLKRYDKYFTREILNLGWFIREYPFYSGIIVKTSFGPSITYFNNGTIIMVGLKHPAIFNNISNIIFSI